jgi:hypothetical protein
MAEIACTPSSESPEMRNTLESFVSQRKSVECPFTESSQSSGVIAHLTRQYGENVQDMGAVDVTSSSIYGDDEQFAAENAADLMSESEFCMKDEAEPWICDDFKMRRIRPTHYAIKSYRSPRGRGYHPQHWVVEGSDNGQSWTELDRRENNKDLKSLLLVATFPVSGSSEIRMIRLLQTGKNHGGDDNLNFSGFEVFGSILE